MVSSFTEQNQNEVDYSMKEQMKKFLIKSLYGFLTVLMFGLGRRVGIFDYLQEKAENKFKSEKVFSVSFTIEELADNLKLEWNYVDAWAHTALDCGLLEIDSACEKCLKTAPFAYDLLINRNQPNYIGDPLGAFYYLAPYQDSILKSFSKNSAIPNIDFTDEVIHDINRMSARFGTLIERIFSKNFKEFCENLKKGGTALEAGCGYGYNLQVWARKYKEVQFVGIDIDPTAIEFAKKMVKKNNWNDRVEVIEIPINEFAKKSTKKFDLITLNQVLHEMDHNIKFRVSVFNSLYSLLKNEGILIVGESMIPDTFAPKQKLMLFDVLHKFLEARYANFYNEKTFSEFIELTPFSKVEFLKEGGNSIWVIRK
jgi:SAM-dependent methyltransferase